MKTKDKIFLAIGSTAIVAAIGFGGYAMFAKPTGISNASQTSTSVSTGGSGASLDASSSSSDSSVSSSDTSSSSSTSSNASYKDGTYTASASYSVPHGYQNTIKVSVIIASGKITAASATHDYSDRESGEYIDMFDSALTSKVVGQSVSSTSFSRIGGASLTTEGFDEALASIQSDAFA